MAFVPLNSNLSNLNIYKYMASNGATVTFDDDIKEMLYLNISFNTTGGNVTTTPYHTLNSDTGTLETMLGLWNNSAAKVIIYKITNVKAGDSIDVVMPSTATGCRHLFIQTR